MSCLCSCNYLMQLSVHPLCLPSLHDLYAVFAKIPSMRFEKGTHLNIHPSVVCFQRNRHFGFHTVRHGEKALRESLHTLCLFGWNCRFGLLWCRCEHVCHPFLHTISHVMTELEAGCREWLPFSNNALETELIKHPSLFFTLLKACSSHLWMNF